MCNDNIETVDARTTASLDQNSGKLLDAFDDLQNDVIDKLLIATDAKLLDKECTKVERLINLAFLVGMGHMLKSRLDPIVKSVRADSESDNEYTELAKKARESGDRRELLAYLRARRGG